VASKFAISSAGLQPTISGAESGTASHCEVASVAGVPQRDGRPHATPEINSLFMLGQNYPNPYLGETTIPFTLLKTAEVKLGIFDLTGRKVAGIVRKELPAGEHSICLNLSGLGLPTGSYVYQLQASNSYNTYQQQKTMTST
jgi:Secretion system C-terminal sorting domain